MCVVRGWSVVALSNRLAELTSKAFYTHMARLSLYFIPSKLPKQRPEQSQAKSHRAASERPRFRSRLADARRLPCLLCFASLWCGLCNSQFCVPTARPPQQSAFTQPGAWKDLGRGAGVRGPCGGVVVMQLVRENVKRGRAERWREQPSSFSFPCRSPRQAKPTHRPPRSTPPHQSCLVAHTLHSFVASRRPKGVACALFPASIPLEAIKSDQAANAPSTPRPPRTLISPKGQEIHPPTPAHFFAHLFPRFPRTGRRWKATPRPALRATRRGTKKQQQGDDSTAQARGRQRARPRLGRRAPTTRTK